MISPFETDVKWESFLHYGKRQFVKSRTVIYNQGSIDDGFYYLHKGLVKIVTTTPKGRDRLLNIVVPGQLMGIQIMDGQIHFTTAIAVRNSVIYHFSREQFAKLLMEYPDILTLMIQTLNQKMQILLRTINMKAFSSEEQIAFLLLNICDEFKNHEAPLTQQDLAHCTGLTRITVYKILKKWKEEGIIEIQNRKFLIKRLDLLRKVAQGTSQ
ncbi:Crp/Fnr family transcriptional regulator [Geobacillus thermodenitrificans]|jgi:CRP-like cAMP-binding protein|uniref:Transcriptional regulator n=1 Tax=Geobacillus thermodenitrificans (strain NG80-2) TaxID=420246 RepID=A4IT53_GEOTN|nr:Crp/Fnr family transcriptional regulator [Geobacillus thermodenitrificans]ABO68507.1 Conserved hypothetical protein [Geobacillus thermodenitrificans NG80-2]